MLTDTIARVRRRRLPRRGLRREGGHAHAPRRPRAAAAPGDRPPKGRSGRSAPACAPGWQVIADVAARAGHDLGVARRADGLAPAVRGGPVLRRADARRDRRPRRALAGRARPRAASRCRRGSPSTLDVPPRAARAADGRAAPRHVPLAVELQGGRRLAGAALPAPAAGGRALARRRRAARDRATATASRSARNGTRVRGAVRLRAAVPGGSVFLAEGTPTSRPTCSPSRSVEIAPRRRARTAAAAAAAAPGRRRPPRAAPRCRRRRRWRSRRPARASRGTTHERARRRSATTRPWWIQLLKALLIFAVVFQLVPIVLLAERKLLGRFQHRYGPNRVGPVRDPAADGRHREAASSRSSSGPRTSIGWLFAIAPAISMMTAVATVAIIPFSNTVDIFGTQVGLYGIDPSIGILYAFAFGAIAFYGLMLGGWASGSKYSFLGAMRAAAQLISYEVSQGLALVGVIMMAGTLSLTEIVDGAGASTSGSSSRSSSASSIFLGRRASRRPTGRRSTSPRPTPSWSAATTPSTAAAASPRTSPPSTSTCIVVSGLTVTLFLGGWTLPFCRPADVGRPDRRAREDGPLRRSSSSGCARRCRACATTS